MKCHKCALNALRRIYINLPFKVKWGLSPVYQWRWHVKKNLAAI